MTKKLPEWSCYAMAGLLVVLAFLLLADKSLLIFLGAVAAMFFVAGEMRQAMLLLFGLPFLLLLAGQDFSAVLFAATGLCGLAWWAGALQKVRLPVDMSEEERAAEPPSEWAVTVEQAKSFFPILLFIFLFRSFLIEPFRIPSGSMKPTLIEGDFIAVNKFAYGIRLPVVNKKIVDLGGPERGDVAVFRYPHNPSVDYIKRVIGLPGDRIVYSDKEIRIQPSCKGMAPNECPKVFTVQRELLQAQGFDDNGIVADIYRETIGEAQHQLLIRPNQPDMTRQLPANRLDIIVPEGHYFMMGDNRDGSNDSRFWGFVPDENLKGEAVAVWMHLDFGFDHPLIGWVPTGVSFSRIDGID